MSSKNVTRAVVVFGLLALSAPAMAQSAATDAKLRSACRSDAMSLCSSVLGNRDAIGKCLSDNVASVSPACKSALAEAKAERQGK